MYTQAKEREICAPTRISRKSKWPTLNKACCCAHFPIVSSQSISSAPQPTRQQRRAKREGAKQRVVLAYKAAATSMKLWPTARRAIQRDGEEPKKHGRIRTERVKVMSTLEESLDRDCRMTAQSMCDSLQSDLQVEVSKTSVHRSLQGMLYIVKKLRIKKVMVFCTEPIIFWIVYITVAFLFGSLIVLFGIWCI